MIKLCCILFFLNAVVLVKAQTFTQVAQNLGIRHSYIASNFGGGLSFYDFDNDGWDDLTVATARGDSIHFYKNIGGAFQKLTAFIADTNEIKQILWGDIDNDGDNDLFAAVFDGPNFIYINDGAFNFTAVALNNPNNIANSNTFAADFGDYDLDGDLDLIIGHRGLNSGIPNQLFRNDGNGVFTDVTAQYFFNSIYQPTFVVAFFDYNKDLYPDIFTAEDRTFSINQLYKNKGGGIFEDITQRSGTGVAIDAMGLTFADYNHDGLFDFYVSNGIAGNPLFQNLGNDTFVDVAAQAGVLFNQYSWGNLFLDYDNDGDADLHVCATDGNYFADKNGLFTNMGNATFVNSSSNIIGFDSTVSFSSALGDINNDGYLDIGVLNAQPDSFNLWLNSSGTNNWLKIKLRGHVSNRDGAGTQIEVYSSGQQRIYYKRMNDGYLGQNSQVMTLGLDSATSADSIVLTWPSGHIDYLYNQPSNQLLTISEGVSGIVLPSIGIIGNDQICQGGTAELYALGNYGQYIWSTGATTKQIVVANSGYYSLTTTDHNGGMASDSIYVYLDSSLSVQLNWTNVSCFGQQDATAAALLPGSSNLYNYQWSNGGTNSSISNLSAGNYTLTVTNNFNCSDTVQFQINAPSLLSLNAQMQQIACFGDSSGGIDLTVTGGSPPYTFNWSNNANTEDITGLTMGSYTVFVQDSMFCSEMLTTTIFSPLSLVQATTNASQLSCYADSNAVIALTVTGGVAPYSYQWSNNDTTQDINGLHAGQYEVTITDYNGCNSVVSDTVFEPDSMMIQFNIIPDSFGNSGFAEVIVAGGTTPYAFNWGNGQTTGFITDMAAGTYTLTVTDAANCVNIVTVNIPSVQITKIVKEADKNKLIVFPNPSDGHIYIDFKEVSTQTFYVMLLDLNGRKIMENTYPSPSFPTALDVRKIPQGAYIIVLKSKQKSWYQFIQIN